MSKGDTKSNGLKGNNHPFQHNSLLALGEIIKNTQGLVPPGGGLATEATQLDILAAIDMMRDYEVRLVVDSDTPNVTWLEVRYWNEQTGTLGTPQYYLPGSTVAGSPVLPINYINPNALLTLLLGELQSIDARLTGAVRPPAHVETNIDGSTTSGVQSVCITFNGPGGTLDGAPVVNGRSYCYTPNKGEDTVGSIAYTVPTGGAQTVHIDYVYTS